jgi:hypothetical protein
MKKVIDGKLYNIETAECIADYDNSYPRNDFHWLQESLYRTKSERFFIAGEGGAMSKYQRSAGSNSWSGGEEIEALTEQEALTWCEEHNIDSDIVAATFKVEEA